MSDKYYWVQTICTVLLVSLTFILALIELRANISNDLAQASLLLSLTTAMWHEAHYELRKKIKKMIQEQQNNKQE